MDRVALLFSCGSFEDIQCAGFFLATITIAMLIAPIFNEDLDGMH